MMPRRDFMTTAKLMITMAMLVCLSFELVVASPNPTSTRRRNAARPVDWSVRVVESTIKRNPTGESFKGWGYAKALYLYGEYLVYLRTKDKRYLDHINRGLISTSTSRARSIVRLTRSITSCPAISW